MIRSKSITIRKQRSSWCARRGQHHAVETFCLIGDPKGWGIFRTTFTPVVDSGRGNVGVTEPFLNLGDIGLMLQCIGRRRCPQAMHAQSLYLDLSARRVSEHDLVDAISSQRCMGLSSCRLKEGGIRRFAMSGDRKISVDAFSAAGMQ